MNVIFLARHSSISLASLPRPSFSASLRNGLTTSRRLFSTIENMRTSFQKTITVTELNTQYDELRQVDEFDIPKESTTSMTEGTRVHNVLELNMDSQNLLPEITLERALQAVDELKDIEESELTDIMRVLKTVDKIMILSENASTMNQMGAVREIYLRGNISGTIVRGYIDGLHIGPHGIILTETKTTSRPEVNGYALRLAYHQALIYHRILNDLLNSKDPASYIVDLFDLKTAGGRLLNNVREPLNRAVQTLRHIGMAQFIYLEFMKRRRRGYYDVEVFELPVDSDVCDAVIKSRFDFINGKREPYTFKQSDILQDIAIVDDLDRPFTPAEASGLNLDVE